MALQKLAECYPDSPAAKALATVSPDAMNFDRHLRTVVSVVTVEWEVGGHVMAEDGKGMDVQLDFEVVRVERGRVACTVRRDQGGEEAREAVKAKATGTEWREHAS